MELNALEKKIDKKTGRAKISVVIHTYNNEDIIIDCLESVKDFDEIVVCDMYSTDKTFEIAREYNCKIVMHQNLGWADPARNFAISKASNDWVLVVDSDEIVTDALKNYLYKFISNPKNVTSIRIPRLNYCWDEPMEVLYPDLIVRFFKKDAVFWPPYVHATAETTYGEEIEIDGKKKELAIVHTHTTSISSLLSCLNKYTDLEVEKLILKNKKINFCSIVWKSFWLILEKYFLKKGYRDGFRGVILAVHYGVYKFVSYAKYWEYLRRVELEGN